MSLTHTTRPDSIAQQIEQLIVSGHLQPGDKVPSERQLCNRFSISRASVREAINILRGRGVIETIHGKGSFVSSLLEEVDEKTPLTRLYHSHPDMLYDLLDVRELLEGHATMLAAERGNEKDFYNIKKSFTAMNRSPKTSEDLKDSALRDHEFHKAIYEASHNPVLIHTLQSLMQLMRYSVEACVTNLYSLTRPKQIIDEDHLNIFTNIVERRPLEAQKAAQTHVRNIRSLLLSLEKEQKKDGQLENWQR